VDNTLLQINKKSNIKIESASEFIKQAKQSKSIKLNLQG